MSLFSGLRKIFCKKRPFQPINEYRLTPDEREQVAIFFGIIATVIAVAGAMIFLQ